MTLAEASSPKQKQVSLPSVSHRRASLFISGLLTMAEPLEPSAVRRPGRYCLYVAGVRHFSTVAGVYTARR
jgi:hypothetical protein